MPANSPNPSALPKNIHMLPWLSSAAALTHRRLLQPQGKPLGLPCTRHSRVLLTADVPVAAAIENADDGDWEQKELWALEDNVAHFSLDKGRFVLWRRMGIEVPELSTRSPEELRAQWLAQQQVGSQLPRLPRRQRYWLTDACRCCAAGREPHGQRRPESAISRELGACLRRCV